MARLSGTAPVSPAVWAALVSRNSFRDFHSCHRNKTRFGMRRRKRSCVRRFRGVATCGKQSGAASSPLLLMRRFHLLPLLLIATLLGWNGFAATALGAEAAPTNEEEHHLSLHPVV